MDKPTRVQVPKKMGKSFMPYKIGNTMINPGTMVNNGDWNNIISFLKKDCGDIRKNLCAGCSASTLYDKNNNPYKISRANTLEQVKLVVEEIRKINAA